MYVSSPENGCGKTMVCAGLGKRLLGDGKKVGFFKPVIAGSKNPPDAAGDSDAAFMKQLFALDEPLDLINPVFSDVSKLRAKVKEAYDKVAQGKDVVIVEGISGQNQISSDLAAALDATVVIVDCYSKEAARAVDSYQDFGEPLLGVVLNRVPGRQVERAQSEASARFSKAGVNLLGILPEDRTLFALTVGELAEHVQGEILRGDEKSAELVENFMLGANIVDHGPDYFGRKANKAVVLRSERPDMQLAALQTSTSCLVITGDTDLMPVVLQEAEAKNVPIILTGDDITAIAANIEDALDKTRFNQENKLPRLTEIMAQHFDFPTLYKRLGLAS